MNLILLTAEELRHGIGEDDPRISHVKEILRFGEEDWFDIGIENGPRGKARVKPARDGVVEFDFELGEDTPPLHPIRLIVGMPRPQTARRLLREMTAMGLRHLSFAVTDRSEQGYAKSKLWATGEYERHLRAGAAQAFCTRIPEVGLFPSTEEALEAAMTPGQVRIALDNYEAAVSLGDIARGMPVVTRELPDDQETLLAIGAERGWSGAERLILKDRGFELAHLGKRVLRVETAAVAAATLLLNARGVL